MTLTLSDLINAANIEERKEIMKHVMSYFPAAPSGITNTDEWYSKIISEANIDIEQGEIEGIDLQKIIKKAKRENNGRFVLIN